MTGTSSPLRIGIIAPCWFPVPPVAYGGIEQIVGLLADGLVAAGHDVTLFASGDSRTDAALATVFEVAPSERIGQTYWELMHLLGALGRAGDFDVLHDHTGMLGLALGGLTKTPLVHTVHGPLDDEPGEMYAAICALNPRARLVSLSRNQRRPQPRLPWLATVPNGIDFDAYPLGDGRGDHLAFLGRMSPSKGCHRAIELARDAGVPLKIAAKCREPEEIAYFEEHVEPYLSDGIEYVGELGHDAKVELLGSARATVFPIEWEEPFGLVLIESMACGTPVIATRRGSVPEVVEHGRGGVVDGELDLREALRLVAELDPVDVRRSAEERFSVGRMVRGYERAYRRAIAEGSPRPAGAAANGRRAPAPAPNGSRTERGALQRLGETRRTGRPPARGI
jgi:glycosyltransferase involved in cell wall biosynthesis